MESEKSGYQLEVEAWVWRREADRRRLCEVVGLAFEPLEDESKGQSKDESKGNTAGTALPRPQGG